MRQVRTGPCTPLSLYGSTSTTVARPRARLATASRARDATSRARRTAV
eukprot:CAMPEP_0202769802 /NCGR_PEP_ID=MMETSP1388-20130828/37429_1 /ASSEMBLY_ACC=CAM_ASM_000864 /TAXON_ID=37098 /ORGANISM="Isochrysis sp, Strain CCMP1244" /LENGTH=47 /DNA_ID= /DNA_START= /DNA_END= /DNA_ORIENTATION=